MKKILLLSDTHSYIDDQIIKFVKQADEVWHAGDIGAITVTDTILKYKPLKAVYGNIDNQKIRAQFCENQVFKCENVKVWMTHIGGYPPKYTSQIKPQLVEKRPNIFICGHSHILKVIPDKKLGLIHINPGAVGKSGFHKVRTMIRFVIDRSNIKDMEIIELGKNRY